jgi:tyrosine-protein phosphatase SIW14
MILSQRLPLYLLVASLPLLAGNAPGIHNFDKVDDHVYRGGQPSNEGLQYLAKIGVKHIIDLRESGSRSRDEEKVATAAGMHYINVPMTGLTPPSEAETAKILAILEGADGPVFVHCLRGADRTGAVIAAYHIDHDKWANGRALQDAKSHGMGFFQLPRATYIRNFQPHTVDASVTKPVDAGVITTNVRN